MAQGRKGNSNCYLQSCSILGTRGRTNWYVVCTSSKLRTNKTIAAGYLTQHLNWRWIFWVVSIADAAVQILAFLFLQETYPPKILKVKAESLRKLTGNKHLLTEFEQRDRTLMSLLLNNLKRPFVMLFTQPAIQITALYSAYLYGLMYLVYVFSSLSHHRIVSWLT